MASNFCKITELLQSNCHTLADLEYCVQLYGLNPSHPTVIARRNELLNNALITDSDMYRLLACCCNTTDDLNKVIFENGLDENDPAVRLRRRDLQVCLESAQEQCATTMYSCVTGFYDSFISRIVCMCVRFWLYSV